MSNIKDILKCSSVFGSLEKADIERLGMLFEIRQIKPGDILAEAKEAAGYFYLLNKGSILLALEDGRSIVLNERGDFMGMELVSAGGIYKTTLTVLAKGSVFAVSRMKFLEIIREDSHAAASINTSWRKYLESNASFVKYIEDKSLPENF
ncbi:MAG: cyclic nucleotide-binding domain-containing protein [Deltaproteobacteria bacterium]|nr:cyclic nucleotide-binding domain-containing protein [Deltaproteobacteria bacterium]